MPSDAEALTIGLAIATLSSRFRHGVDVIDELKTEWRGRQDLRTRLAELDKVQVSLVGAQSTVQRTYDAEYQRCGARFQIGDDLAQYILFTLAALQDALFLRKLQSMDIETMDFQPLVSSIESTKTAATSCLLALAARARQPIPPSPLTFQQKSTLWRDHQNLCPSAALYRGGQVHHSQLGALSSDKGRLSCHECGAILGPTKLRIPNADASSCVLITLSGLFRAHCHAGSGLTCIWQPRAPSCYGVFDDEKMLLKHLLAVHFRDDEDDGRGIKVDWPADSRQGDVAKCGFMIYMNGMQMRNLAGSLFVPRRRPGRVSASSANASRESFPTMYDAATSVGSLSESDLSTVNMLTGDRESGHSEAGGEGNESVVETPPPPYVRTVEMGRSAIEQQRYEMGDHERFELQA